MDLPIIDNSAAYVKFCQKNNLKIGKVPTSKEEMGLAQEMLMREQYTRTIPKYKNPVDDLPADTKLRYQSQKFWIDDIDP